MHTMNPRILGNLIKQIQPYVNESVFEIPVWESRTGVHTGGGVTQLSGDSPVMMNLGDRYNIGYDDTRYFDTTVIIPEGYGGAKLYLNIDFGGEGIIRINGEIESSVSSRANSGWVGRERVLLGSSWQDGDRLDISIENAVDSAGFCDDAMAGKKFKTYEMKTACIEKVNTDAESLWYDVITVWDAYKNTEDKYVAKRLYNALDTAVHKLSFDMGKPAFYASIHDCVNCLWAKLAEIDYASPGKVLLAGHSHIDVGWLWTVAETHRKCARTFSSTVALMDKYPDFRFCQSQAVLYDFVKNDYPELFEKIKRKVAAGQWEIVGSAWVEADTNIASGESLIRQLLYGREFFKKEFGTASDVYWLPDCFGFTAALPQIIKKSGMKYFITSKLQYNDTNEFPLSAFRWRSHSGDEVLAYMQKVPYSSEATADYIVRTRSTNCQNDLVDASIGMYGYGDGGGGCTYDMIEKLRRFERIPGMPRTEMSFARDFFNYLDASADELPVWDGEMYYENHRGTFTSQAFVKKNNRRGEFGLRNAELLGTLAGTYNKEETDSAWKLLLVNQFHDILPGTSIHEVFENTRKEYEDLTARYTKMTDTALDAMLPSFGIGDNSIVVFNPNATKADRTAVFAFSADSGVNGVMTVDETPVVSSVSVSQGRIRLEFIAQDVPPMGYRVYKLTTQKCEAPAVTAEKNLLENEYLRIRLDENGHIISVYDKENNREVMAGRGNLFSIGHDKPIHESAWNLENDYKMHRVFLENATAVEVLESSPVKGVIGVQYGFNESVIKQQIILYAGARTVNFDTIVSWKETEKILKVEFPVDIRSRFSTFEIAHGATERPTYANNPYERAQFECCAHKWTDLSEGDYGVSLMNDCKYGYNIDENVMCLTLLRAPVCPDTVGDKETHRFVYSLYPHKGSWSDAHTPAKALELNNKCFARFCLHGTGKQAEKSFILPDCENIVIDAFKPAEDGNGFILRVYESEHRHSKVKIAFTSFLAGASECNMMEEGSDPVDFDSSSISFSIAPYEVRTFRLAFSNGNNPQD